jgi:hypothetical protein
MADTHIVLTGDAAGESIGSELALSDINGDGARDLLVGAPGVARDDGGFGTLLMIAGE